MKQKTLSKSVTFCGIGLHSGTTCKVTIEPAPINTGIRFIRTDCVPYNVTIADFRNVIHTKLATTIRCADKFIMTVEHLLAALYGLQIDNAFIKVHGQEIPILDGSAKIFAQGIIDANIIFQNANRKKIKVLHKVHVTDDGKSAQVTPHEHFLIEAKIFWDHPVIGEQHLIYKQNPSNFIQSIAPARTFGFLEEIQSLKKQGLIQGGDLSNAIVLDKNRVVNPEYLTFSNEFVRHKILDALGDLSLSGYSFVGHFHFYKGGHKLHKLLLEALFADPTAFEIFESEDEEELLNITAEIPAFRNPSNNYYAFQ